MSWSGGNARVNVDPPGPVRTSTVPSLARATLPTMASPSPAPGIPRAPGGPVEALEDVREILVRDARALLADQDPAVLDDDAHRGAWRTPLDGVVDQVADGVIGVRSSCDASATSWRWAVTDSCSAASMVPKDELSRPTSS